MLKNFFETVFATNQFDLTYFVIAYITCLTATFYTCKAKYETNIKPIILDVGLFLYICILIACESDGVTNFVVLIKIIITLASCFAFKKLLGLMNLF